MEQSEAESKAKANTYTLLTESFISIFSVEIPVTTNFN